MNYSETIRNYIKSYNAKDISSMVALFTKDCIFENVSNNQDDLITHGQDALLKLAEKSINLFSHREQKIERLNVGENHAVAEILFIGTLSIDINDNLKQGQVLKLKGVSIFEFEDNKISRLVDFS